MTDRAAYYAQHYLKNKERIRARKIAKYQQEQADKLPHNAKYQAGYKAALEVAANLCEHNKHRQDQHDDEYATGYVDASLDCAAAIRARGE